MCASQKELFHWAWDIPGNFHSLGLSFLYPSSRQGWEFLLLSDRTLYGIWLPSMLQSFLVLTLPSDWPNLENRLSCFAFKFPVYSLALLGTQKMFLKWMNKVIRHWDLLGSGTITNRWIQTQTSSVRRVAQRHLNTQLVPSSRLYASWQQRVHVYCCILIPRRELRTLYAPINIHWINEWTTYLLPYVFSLETLTGLIFWFSSPPREEGGMELIFLPPPNPMVYCRCIFADVSLNLNVRQARSAPQRAKRSSHPETQCSGWAESRWELGHWTETVGQKVEGTVVYFFFFWFIAFVRSGLCTRELWR